MKLHAASECQGQSLEPKTLSLHPKKLTGGQGSEWDGGWGGDS